MSRSVTLGFTALVLLSISLDAVAQTYVIDFNQFQPDSPAESLGIPEVTLTSNPPSTWYTVDSRDLDFVGLGGICLFQPFDFGSLDIAFKNPVSSVAFSFAQSDETFAQLKAEAFNGTAIVGSVTQTATPPGPGLFVEGFLNLAPGPTFNRVRISSVSPNLIAIDNIRADGVLIAGLSVPNALVQFAGAGGATASYTIANRGSATAAVSMGRNGQFFTQSPESFTLAPGATQKITITGTGQPFGAFLGSSNASVGGTRLLETPVALLSAPAPTLPVQIVPSQTRVDVAGDGQSANGVVTFRNNGSETISAIAVSDVPWIVPQSGVITLAPAQTVQIAFTIQRARRPDGGSSVGSFTGSLRLTYPTAGATREPFNTASGTSLVSVVDTSNPTTSQNSIPPLQGPALFLTGVGHVTGGNNVVFISDVAIGNAVENFSLGNVALYFTPRDGSASSSTSSSISTLLPNQTISLADVVKNVYNNDQTVGTMQIRAGVVSNLSVAASIFNASDPRGTFGTAIPVLRSDRSITIGQKLYLPGLKQDATHRTNFYLQETGGGTPTVRTDFLDANGNVIGTRTDSLQPFRMLQIVSPAPAGTVTAVVTQTGGSGTVSGYATPLDSASGDTWAVTDWGASYGAAPTEKVLIPIAGSAAGALGTFFRTDVAATNIGSTSGNVRFTYRPIGAAEIVKTVSISPNRSYVVQDIVKNLFNVTGDSLGYILVDPLGRSITVTSRTYTTVAGSTATYGTAVPAIPLSAAMKLGDKKVIGALQDSSLATLSAGTPATFRTNVDIVETAGAPATVKITLLFADGRSLAGSVASKTYEIGANQLFRINRITDNILGAARADYGDIRNLQLKFEVIAGSGRVVPTVSSTDNGTGDSILRVP